MSILGCGVSVTVQQKPQGPVVQEMLSILPTLDAYVLKVAGYFGVGNTATSTDVWS